MWSRWSCLRKSEVVFATHKHVTRAPQNQLSPNPWFSIQSSPILSHCPCVGLCISISRRQHYNNCSWYDLVQEQDVGWDHLVQAQLHHNATRLILVPTVGSTWAERPHPKLICLRWKASWVWSIPQKQTVHPGQGDILQQRTITDNIGHIFDSHKSPKWSILL
jgi:hypothetical protein